MIREINQKDLEYKSNVMGEFSEDCPMNIKEYYNTIISKIKDIQDTVEVYAIANPKGLTLEIRLDEEELAGFDKSTDSNIYEISYASSEVMKELCEKLDTPDVETFYSSGELLNTPISIVGYLVPLNTEIKTVKELCTKLVRLFDNVDRTNFNIKQIIQKTEHNW